MIEGTYQPMKIAAAEAQWNTCRSRCSFSVVPGRRRKQRSGAETDHSDSGTAVDPGHQSPEW